MFNLPLRIYAYIGLVAAIGLSIGFMRHHWIQEGLARQRTADAAELAQAVVRAEKKEKEWEKKYVDVQTAFEGEVAANHAQPSIGPVRVCRPPAPSAFALPPAPDAANGPAAITGSLPSGDGVPDGGTDIGYSLEMLARSADAVVAECRRLKDSVTAP